MKSSYTRCYLIIAGGEEKSPEGYDTVIQLIVNMFSFEGNTNWVCNYDYKPYSERVISTGSGGFSVWVNDLRPKEMYIGLDRNPITKGPSSKTLLLFDFASMSLVDNFTDGVTLEELPTIEQLSDFINQANNVIAAKSQSRNRLTNLVVGFLVGMCGISNNQAKAMAKSYSESVSDEDLKKFPNTDQGIIFRIASDWSRRREVFG